MLHCGWDVHGTLRCGRAVNQLNGIHSLCLAHRCPCLCLMNLLVTQVVLHEEVVEVAYEGDIGIWKLFFPHRSVSHVKIRRLPLHEAFSITNPSQFGIGIAIDIFQRTLVERLTGDGSYAAGNLYIGQAIAIVERTIADGCHAVGNSYPG